MSTPSPVGFTDVAARYALWKDEHVPLLYDWLSSRTRAWPHAAVQWGGVVPKTDNRGGNTGAKYTTRSLYTGERTGVGTDDPDTLLHYEVRVVEEFSNRRQEIAAPWVDESVNEGGPDFWLKKVIVHPGEVNKIRLLAPDVVITHTDSPQLFVWDMNRQPERARDVPKRAHSSPNCTLVGHAQAAEYALSVASDRGPHVRPEEARVASGGKDCRVLAWKLRDYESFGKNVQPFVQMGNDGSGHARTVEDVSFNREDHNLLVSVGLDSALMLWDLRTPKRPAAVVKGAHEGDVNCCDFGGVDANLIVSGGADTITKVWDARRLVNSTGGPSPRNKMHGHHGEIHCVAWNPFIEEVCASGGQDSHVNVWNCKNDDTGATQSPMADSPALLFRHVGHALQESIVTDFEWQPDVTDPWCIASISESVGDSGGSVLQIWRISDLVRRPEDQVTADLRRHVSGSVLGNGRMK